VIIYILYLGICIFLIVFKTVVLANFALFSTFYDILLPVVLYLGLFRPVIEGLPTWLVDAAGIGEAQGIADAEAMRRARIASESADLVLIVFDAFRESLPEFTSAQRRLLVGTHQDLLPAGAEIPGVALVSSVTGHGVPELRRTIAERLRAPGAGRLPSVAPASARHRDASARAARALRHCEAAAGEGRGAEILCLDLREAISALQEILGNVGPEDLLGRIFARFCIGK